MSIRAITAAAIIAVLFAFAGCSSSNPVISDSESQVAATTGYVGGDGVLARAKLHLDTDAMTATILPSRLSSATGDFLADFEITSFMAYPYCTDATCLYVKGLGIEAGTPPDIKLTIGVRHPFAVFNTANPPSGINRADLDLFDMRVYLVNDGGTAPNPAVITLTGFMYPSTPPADIKFTPDLVVGADGYDDGGDAILVAPPLDAAETSELMNYMYAGQTKMQPYMRAYAGTADAFAFVPGSAGIADDNRMSHGESDEVTFVLNLAPGGGAIDFDLAFTGEYGQSATGKPNRTPTNVKYFKAFRSQRPFIGLQTPSVTAGTLAPPVSPTLNFQIIHSWATLTAAADAATYKAQTNNAPLLPPGAKGPATTDLTFQCRVTDGVNTYDYTALPTATGTGTDADPWKFSLALETTTPGTPIPNGTYMVYIYVTAGTGTSTDYLQVGTDNYTLYFASGLAVATS